MSEVKARPPIFELDRYTFWTSVEGNKRAAMSFGIKEGYPRITVFTNTQSDHDGKGAIIASFDLEHFLIFLNHFEKVVKTNGPSKEMVNIKHFPRDTAGKITGDREVTGELWFGKNEEGVVWISAQQPNRPKIVFEILLSDFHEFRNSTGQLMTKGEGSISRALTLVPILRHHFIDKCLHFRNTSTPREKSLPYSQRGNQTENITTSKPTGSVYDNMDESDIPY